MKESQCYGCGCHSMAPPKDGFVYVICRRGKQGIDSVQKEDMHFCFSELERAGVTQWVDGWAAAEKPTPHSHYEFCL